VSSAGEPHDLLAIELGCADPARGSARYRLDPTGRGLLASLGHQCEQMR
jgi:hypothetical protein